MSDPAYADPVSRLQGLLRFFQSMNHPSFAGDQTSRHHALNGAALNLRAVLFELEATVCGNCARDKLERAARAIDDLVMNLPQHSLLDERFLRRCFELAHRIDVRSEYLPRPEYCAKPASSYATLIDRATVLRGPGTTLSIHRLKRLTTQTEGGTLNIVLSNAFNRGSFGKLRMTMIEPGVLEVAKELRLRASKPAKARATVVSFGKFVDREIDTMRITGSRLSPSRRIQYNNKEFLVMPLMLGSVEYAVSSIRASSTYASLANQALITLGRSMLLQVATQLDKIHSMGFVHCDLKPDNILIGADGSIELADFGATQRAGVFAPTYGTPFFMPNEDTPNQPMNLTPAIDIFSLGLSYLDLLQAHRPPGYHDKTGDARLAQVTTAAMLDPEVTGFVIRSMVHPNPSLRASAREVSAFMQNLTDCNLSRHECKRIVNIFMAPVIQDHQLVGNTLQQHLIAPLPDCTGLDGEALQPGGRNMMESSSGHLSSLTRQGSRLFASPDADFNAQGAAESPALVYVPNMKQWSP